MRHSRTEIRRPSVRTALLSAAVAFALVVNLVPSRLGAADDKQLQRVKGTVGYQASDSAPFTGVVGKFLLPDDYLAMTRGQSAALLALPDSSLVGLGENTRVQVGAFDQSAAGPGATITVNGGTLRFDIRRPVGGAANYHFTTPTTQMAVRGTVGLLSFVNGITTVACVVCAADSVSVTVGAQTIALTSGQILTISAAGVVVAGTLTAAVLGGFSSAGVSTSAATGTSAATTGVAGAGAAGSSAATTAAIAGAVAAGGIAAGIAASQPSPSPRPTGSQQPTPTPTPTPTAAPQPSPSQSGAVTITGRERVMATPPNGAHPK
jgi:hypothetical protein